MTPPPRPSASVRVAETLGTSIKSLIVGAMLFGPGLYWFVTEIRSGDPVHTLHISIAVGLMVAGGVAIQPPFGKQLAGIYVMVFPNGLPFLGGRRSGDPQPPA